MAEEDKKDERVGAARLVDENKVNKVDKDDSEPPIEVDSSLMERGGPGTKTGDVESKEPEDGEKEETPPDYSKLPKGDDGEPRDLAMDELKELKEAVVAELKTIFDPEIPVNIYELGMIYNVSVTPRGEVAIKMTLTSPACPVADKLPGEVEDKIREVDTVTKADVNLVWDPPWDKSMMSEAAKLELNVM